MPTLTVFTPAYNRAHTITRTYESLCRQTCKDFTWLVVDDGSTDGTRALIEQWIAAGVIDIRYIYQANQGMHGAHNTAYRNITTELNTCIDSDDYMPDAGSMMALFSTCTGVEPLVMGKPEVYTADYLTELLHCRRDEICFIGDSLAADIALGVRHGMKTACVLTGVTTPEIYEKSNIKADVCVDSIKDLCEIFR